MTHGDLLDVVLIVLTLLTAAAGFRRGLVLAVSSFFGLLVGALIGVRVAPHIVNAIIKGPKTVLAADQAATHRIAVLIVVLVFAGAGHWLGTAIGGRIRAVLARTPIRPVDGIGGAVFSAVSFLALAWLCAVALAYLPAPALSRQIHRSLVLHTIDRAVPPSGHRAAATFLREVQLHGLPSIVGPFSTVLAPAMPVPDQSVVGTAVRASEASIVKIVGEAPSCNLRLEGSGFEYATDRVMTNAHVVAGVTNPQVQVPGRGVLNAQVVVFDPDRDIAVLRVPGLGGKALSFNGVVGVGASAVVAGYPEDGPFTAVPARIASRGKVSGPNIYQTRPVTRDVYTFRGQVRHGNSGGPLLDPSGAVDGVVFAASVDQADVGYALTAAEVQPDADLGRTATTPTSSQGCD